MFDDDKQVEDRAGRSGLPKTCWLSSMISDTRGGFCDFEMTKCNIFAMSGDLLPRVFSPSLFLFMEFTNPCEMTNRAHTETRRDGTERGNIKVSGRGHGPLRTEYVDSQISESLASE